MPSGIYIRTEKHKVNWFPKGEKHWNWKNGRIIHPPGYILILNRNHPLCSANGYVYEHRLVAEKCLGRYLLQEERIHHINGVFDDNRPENLYLFPSRGFHIGFHHLKNKPQLVSNLSNESNG